MRPAVLIDGGVVGLRATLARFSRPCERGLTGSQEILPIDPLVVSRVHDAVSRVRDGFPHVFAILPASHESAPL